VPQTIETIAHTTIDRLPTGLEEFDRVLGGGFVAGSFILLSGEPGIGKSTLALQVAALVPNTIYFSGEESIEQVALRAKRLGLTHTTLRIANTSDVQSIVATIHKERAPLIIVDSIQTMTSPEATGEAGNPTQIRACTVQLLSAAKATGTAILMIGHVTKDGSVAGPKTLEHLVDTVLYFEGDPHRDLRLVRAVKNRFGSTDEVGMFDMVDNGLRAVKNPSAQLLGERGESMPGSVVTCLMEGTRPLLVEIQALVNKTIFGYPIRKASGFDVNRLHVLAAVLERRAGLHLAQYDIHVNIVGGLEANEPAADLAVSLAIASAYKDKSLGTDLVVCGEVGLGGEIRSVRSLDKRLKESIQLGMKRIITAPTKHSDTPDIKVIPIKNIQELITHT
jgi:DNA repair protein RadA/Sms